MGWLLTIPHRAWIGLILCLILGCIGNIYLLFQGNELAWKNRQFSSIEEFKTVQKAWLKWGLILLVLSVVLGVIIALTGGLAALFVVRNQ